MMVGQAKCSDPHLMPHVTWSARKLIDFESRGIRWWRGAAYFIEWTARANNKGADELASRGAQGTFFVWHDLPEQARAKEEGEVVLRCTFDGSSAPNPGISGAGIMIWLEYPAENLKVQILEAGVELGWNTNNGAETAGMRLGIELVEKLLSENRRCESALLRRPS